MAGIQNNIIYGGGYKLQTSSARDISDMQMLASDVSKVNHIGSPEGVVSANPSSLCHDPVSGIVYIKQTGVGNTGWAVLSTSTTGLNTLTDDVGTVITPSLTNIQLVGHVVEQGATKFSTVVQGAAIANINPMASSRWIVDPLGFNGTHTTIQAAINAATSGDNVFIMEGIYTTDLTLKAGVNLIAYRGSGRTSTVTIIGNCTFNTAGTATISGCRLQTNGSFCISNTGTLASILNIIDCDIQASNNTAINFTNSNAASQIFVSVSTMNLGTTGISLHIMTSVGILQYRYCNISNTGASTTASSNSAGTVIFYYCNVFSPLATSAAGVIQKRYSYVDTSAQNVTCLTTAGTGTTEIDFGGDSSGTATSIVVGAGTTVSVNSTNIYSNNAAAISGAGTLKFSLLTFEGTSSVITVTTQIPRAVSNDAVVLKTPGAYPYTTIPQDNVILVDTTAAITITPLASPTKGQMHRIKDSSGLAATNNITITPSGKNIDGAASKIINTNYGSIDIVYNGTEWSTLTSGANGTVTSVSGTLNRVTVTAGSAPVVDISASYVGQSSITTLGTIATGVWNGTAVDATHGGTNQTTWATGDLLYASAANTLSKLTIGATGTVLKVAGGIPSWAAQGVNKVVRQVFAASGTYTPTAGMLYCDVEVVGAGGGSGGCVLTGLTTLGAAGGGGGGGYARKVFSAATIGVSQTVTIGAGGAAGSTSGGNGGTGGTTSLGALISATGGGGGVGCSTAEATVMSGGGVGGQGSSGDFNTRGDPGQSGFGLSFGGNALTTAGKGGSSYYGGGGIGTAFGNTATAGGAPGGGASGASNPFQGLATAGAIGGAGAVIITEYTS